MNNNTIAIREIRPYNMELLRNRFCSMSQNEILAEYARILNTCNLLNRAYGNGCISFDCMSSKLETWDTAKDYIAGYLALCFVSDAGYYQDASGFYHLATPPKR